MRWLKDAIERSPIARAPPCFLPVTHPARPSFCRIVSSAIVATRLPPEGNQPRTYLPYISNVQKRNYRAWWDSTVSWRLSEAIARQFWNQKATSKQENSFVRSLADRRNNVQNPVGECCLLDQIWRNLAVVDDRWAISCRLFARIRISRLRKRGSRKVSVSDRETKRQK